MTLSNSHARTVGLITLSLSPLLLALTPSARATTILGTEVHFKPDSGQPIFPAGNINVFKQFVLDWNERETVGGSTSIWLLGSFGGSVTAGMEMAFGLEMGLCFGGNADFDLGFRPSITLPDRYPTEVPIPLTVAAGLLPGSNFTTTFPPLGKAYADMIFHMEADLEAEACVFGCADFEFDFSTCDIPPLVPGGDKLFKESVRCDPSLTARKYCALELASFNREDDNCVKILNVGARNFRDFLYEPYKEYCPSLGTKKTFTADAATDRITLSGSFAPFYGGAPVKVSTAGELPAPLDDSITYYIIFPEGSTCKLATRQGSSTAVDLATSGAATHTIELDEANPPDNPLDGRYGSVNIAVPTVETDSTGSPFNTCEILKSTGAEDIFAAKLDVAALVSDFILPPEPFPRLKDSGSKGPLSWAYTLASLDLGPAVKLQTDFEMTWDLLVKDITFTVPGSGAPGTPRDVNIKGQRVNKLSQVLPARTYHLTNCGPFAMPPVSLITAPVGSPGQLPVQVTITYEIRPKLKTVVSTPFYGLLEYEALAARISLDYVGGLEFGPLIEGDHKFKFGEFTVYNGNPSPISAATGQVGTITFPMQGSGPPSFAWRPSQLPRSSFDWSQIKPPPPATNGKTNWLETSGSGSLMTGFPGMGGGANVNSDAKIDPPPTQLDNPTPILYDSRTIASFQVSAARRLDIRSKNAAGAVLTVGGGLVENSGIIDVGPGAATALWINSKDAVLCGPVLPDGTPLGTLLLRGSSLKGYAGPEPASFSNYNAIRGTGAAMDEWSDTRASTVNNMGTVTADSSLGSCNALTLTLKFDNNPEQTEWEIRNAGELNEGRLEATSGGPVYSSEPDGSTLVIPLALPPGSYWLTVYDTGANGMCCGFGNGSYSLRNSSNTLLGTGSSFGVNSAVNFTVVCNEGGLLTTSGTTVINQGTFAALANTDGNLYGQKLDTRVSSRITADGNLSRNYLSFQQAEHAGLVAATNGGTVHVGPFYALHPRSNWNAGQSFTNDVGYFRATGVDALLEVQDADISGGCFLLSGGGAITAEESTFTGSVFHIGDFNPALINEASGFLTLSGSNRTYTGTCLSNYGTVTVAGQADFVDSVMFSNNGKIAVTAGGVLRIRQKTIAGASDAAPETKTQPGAANASAATLIGGIWDVAGALLIDGAAFTGIGANAAGASTTRGSVDGAGVAALALENDKSRVLSLGDPGKVTLRGANWSFPALTTLAENRGRLCLVEGAVFPRTPVNTPGSLTNKGAIRIEAGSRMNVGGAFIQKGARSTTDIISGTLVSSTKNFQIIGGRVTATADSNFFNRFGTTIPAGTTIRVESPLIDTNEVDIFGNPTFLQERVSVNLGAGVQIESIAAGADVTVHGGAVDFEALESHLRSNAGTFTLSGDNIDNSGDLELRTFTNTGRVNVLGGTTELLADYVQNGAAAVTHIGGGAALKGNVTINAGQIILDIAGRPSSNRHAIINAGTINLGNNLVIDFNGELGTPAARLDTGDTWEIVPRTTAAVLTVGTPTYKWNGGALPAGFLPAGTHLETIRFNTESGLRGFGIRVVPNGGFLTYDAWATSKGMPANYRRDPYYDADSNGRTNAQEFLFGAVAPAAGSVREVTGTDGKIYREFIYTRAAGNHDARFAPYASTDKVNWYPAPMNVMSVTPVAGTMELVVLRSPFPATGEKVYYRIQADLNPDNFADDSGLIPGKPIGRDFNALNGRGHVAGQVLFFNINTPNSSFDSIWGTNATGYGDWSSLPTACIHAGLLPAGSHGLAKVTFFPKLASYTGAPANGVTPQAPGNYPGTNDPAGVSYRVALSSESGPVDSVNFVSNSASLASLETSAGSLTPVFASGTISYSVNVPNAVTSVTLTPTLADGTASMRLNGVLPVASGVATSPLPVNPGTTVFTVNVTAQDTTTTKTYSLSVTRLASDFTVTTTGNAIVVTDIAGFSDTLDITQPSAGNILFASPGRTFKVNGGPVLSGSSGILTRTGITSIAVNAGDGFDTINVDAFTGTLPSLTINGGTGNDTVNFNGDLTLAANASLNLDLQNDTAEPGDDSITLDANANILTSGTGSIMLKVSQAVRLAAGASLETVNGGITVEAGHPSTAQDDFYGILLEGGAIRSTGTGTLTLTADSMMLAGPVSAGAPSSVSLRQKSNTTAINLGSADFVDTLGLTDAELDQISAANITIGDALTPMITISAPVSRAASTALRLVADPAAGSIVPAAPGADLNLAGGTLTIGGPGSTLAMGITGLTPDTQFTQLKVAGGVNLTGARLFLNSTFAGTAGNVFTVVDNDGADAITGTFAGLPAASEIAWPGSATLLARISYTGGTGNDVTLTLVPMVTNDLIARGASWKYLAPLTAAAAPALTWRNPGFAETGWLTGNAEIGYGDTDEATIIPTTSGKPFTVYFRRTFTVTNPAAFSALTLSLLRDDGAVVYLNGVEVWRSNMPELTAITYATGAGGTVGNADEQVFYTRLIEPQLLVPGTNVLAVEVHQIDTSSSDISFNTGLVATPGNPDTDADGMPDAWENANFGNLNQTASGDTDGDSRSNLSEWKARTNPLNSRDAFIITSANLNPGRQTTLTWPTVPGVGYRVQRSTVTSGWASIGTILTGTGLSLSYTDTAPPAGAPRLIYRVVVP